MERQIIVTGTLIILMVVMSLFVGNAEPATIDLGDTASNVMVLNITNDTNVSAFNIELSHTPTEVLNIGDIHKDMAWYGKKIIIYGLNDTPVASGDLLRLTFGDITYGTHNIDIVDIAACDGAAVEVTGEVNGGVIAITFSSVQVVDTALEVVDAGTNGVDIDEDGAITVRDVQTLANNLE